MMTCTNCKKQIPADSAFCPFCGMIIAESKSGTQIRQHEEVMTSGGAFAIPEGKKSASGKTQSENVPADCKPCEERTALQERVIYRAHNTQTVDNSVIKVTPKGRVWKWVSIALIVALLSGIGCLLYDRSAQIRNNNALTARVAVLSEEKSTAERERARAAVENRYYRAIKTWVTNYSNRYRASSDYYAGSNVIAVVVGETVALDVTYKGDRYMWVDSSTGNCKIEWGKNWDNNTTTLKITGLNTGTSELSFSLGDSEKEDSIASFNVLVIVVEGETKYEELSHMVDQFIGSN